MFKLMIVDDEMLMRIGIRSIIDWEEHGFRVVSEAANGKEALELALDLKPDVIMTDIKMPVMDGLQLIREASRALPACEFIVLSNFDEFRYAKEACQLGAADYLIKTEVTPPVLGELLAGIRQRLQREHTRSGLAALPPDFTQSLTHLKESLFKDLISGLLDEKEAIAKAQQLQSGVRSEELAIVKMRIDRFGEVRKKYVEKDEKLLRFSIVNILGEIIPARWSKEIVIESSADYLLIVNTSEGTMAAVRKDIQQLCGDIQLTIKEVMNLSLSIGISAVVPGFRWLKTAYEQADQALRRKFLEGVGRTLFYEDGASADDVRTAADPASESAELALISVLESHNEAKLEAFFAEYRRALAAKTRNEREVREAYIRLTELIGARGSYAKRPHSPAAEPSPYEEVLSAETREELHDIVLRYARQTMIPDTPSSEQRNYADMAARLIQRFYAEDLSLRRLDSYDRLHNKGSMQSLGPVSAARVRASYVSFADVPVKVCV
ncbi:response regulator [Cohnella fermenti]|uniref:Response regulator n=1 Tax=Cohnella fermenti TaxID=2565925 RepID=A0A4S4BNX4_9BACL|nr:response regulator [Cohnella fermenti]